MTIPFLQYFKRGKEKAAPVAPPPPPPPIEKPSSERFSKTVMPSAARQPAPQMNVMQPTTREAVPAMGSMPTPPPGPPRIIAASPTPPRSVSFVPPPVRTDLPPAVALAIEPKVERVISLALSDVVPQIPAGYAKPVQTFDATRRVLLKAADVERGMSNGRPTVALSSIYQQVPEIFLREIKPDDTMQIALPFGKVLDEFTKLQVRADQQRQASVPQVETPFLKVTMEDGERFGTPMAEPEAGEVPPVRLEPATAEAYAAAEPEAAAAAKQAAAPPPAIKMPAVSLNSPAPAAPPAPARIPFKLSPNGTDASATESVPAFVGGPSVPSEKPVVPPPAVPAPAPVPPPTSVAPPAPARIPFSLKPAVDDAPPKPEPWLTAKAFGLEPDEPVVPAAKNETKIRLGLRTVLKSLPAFQLSGEPGDVPADVTMELAFSLVEPQLASGRVTVDPKVFAAGIPEVYRSIFNAESAAVVSLPLQEVLKNLPAASLRMRDDQVEQEVGANFETPFSTKAKEDAERFKVASAPIAKPEPEPEPDAVAETEPEAEPELEEIADEEAPVLSSDHPIRTPLQVALDTDERLDAKGVVAHINRLPGVKASAIMFDDGLHLAGGLPAEVEAEGLCAMAPSLMQRVENHMTETQLGALRGMTLACTKGTVSFFMHEHVCLAALHSNGEIASAVREKLGRVVHEISRKYSHPI